MEPGQKLYRFNAVLERFPMKGGWHFVTFPYSVEAELGRRGPVAMEGTCNGHSIRKALIPKGDGTHFLVVNTELRRLTGLVLGQEAYLEISRVTDPDLILLPEEMEAALDLEPEARVTFDKLTPGTRRQICYWVDSAKRPDTRANRAAEMLRRLLSGEFSMGGRTAKT